MSKFKITDETGKEREATLLINISYDSNNYAIYSINRDNDNINIFISKLIKNMDNTAILVDIYDEVKKKIIDNIVKEVIKTTNPNDLKEKRIDIFNDVDYINSNNLLFTTYKSYVFSMKKDLYERVFLIYNIKTDSQTKDKLLMENDYIELVDEQLNFMDDYPQKINEEKNALFTIEGEKVNQIEDNLKKISIEKLNINDEESLKDMFDEKKTITSNSKGFVSDLILTFIGLSAFIVTIIFLIVQFKIAH